MRIGSLFSGTGGLDLGVQAVLGGEVAWNVEYDEAPSKILEHHWPGVPNYGDVTTIDWAAVPPIDILTAGYPCQPFSIAGKRKGSNDERHLWPYVLDAVRQLRPRYVVLENVRGHLTLGFDRVLGDLAEAGYDAEWICLPASAAGAPHIRYRIFILATPQDADRAAGYQRGLAASRQAEGGRSRADAGGRGGASASDADCDGRERWGATRDLASASGEGEGDGKERERDGDAADDRWRTPGAWGPFGPAIARWEAVTGRLAPAPTRPDGRGGAHRLSPEFVEWMMGLPNGHVTGAPINRKAQLKALGNGVVPQHAELALTTLIEHVSHSSETT